MVQLAGGDFFVEVHVGVDGTTDEFAGRADFVVCVGVPDVGEDAIGGRSLIRPYPRNNHHNPTRLAS